MLVVTTESVAGHRTVQSLGHVVGGSTGSPSEILNDPWRVAVDRLVVNASLMGAHAVLMMRFGSAVIAPSWTEIVAYGTAAIIEPG